jgi:hypothetical protein
LALPSSLWRQDIVASKLVTAREVRDRLLQAIREATATISGVGSLTAHAVMQPGGDRSLYETDTAAWAQQQSDALRRRAANEIDWNNVAEEIEDVVLRQKDQIESRLTVLCEHLLKWQFQPTMRSGSWRGSVVEARDRIASVSRKTPA